MKTMIVIAHDMLERHDGEEYDSIVVVPKETVTPEEYQGCGKKILAEIKALRDIQKEEPEDDKSIRIEIDAPTPIALILTDLREILKRDEGIILELPWYKSPDVTKLDAQSREALEKIGGEA